MAHLQDKHKPNLIYLAAKGFGTMRTGGGDSRIPTDRMPYGVLEYSLQFFNASHTNQITCPPDLRKFTQTIYDEIGGKGLNLFTGPMFKAGDCTPGTRDPMKAKVNIPTVSRSTLNRDMKDSGFISGPYIQDKVLSDMKENMPTLRVWLKGDATDVNKGLFESRQLEWNGDVDMGDGTLQKTHKEYIDNIQTIKKTGLGTRRNVKAIVEDLLNLKHGIENDLLFAKKGVSASMKENEKIISGKIKNESKIRAIQWDMIEFTHIVDCCTSVLHNMKSILKDITGDGEIDLLGAAMVCSDIDDNILHTVPDLSQRLTSMRETLVTLQKGVMRKRRVPASHVFVWMVSDEFRQFKPYALPVKWFAYKSLTDVRLRDECDKVVQALHDKGYEVLGLVTDGEFNSLRTTGRSRPISIWALQKEAKAEFQRKPVEEMVKMLTVEVCPGGSLRSKANNPYLPESAIQQIVLCQEQGMDIHQIASLLRVSQVPQVWRDRDHNDPDFHPMWKTHTYMQETWRPENCRLHQARWAKEAWF
ncbi:uncharacterized protein [Ptychodera flava]|uniref:uncharacterized protein isoform X2 n=1 Tax=Ptychodera flava TaxID=63121 RepID=UPI003969BE5B